MVAVSLTKIAGDLALMGSGPRAGIGELFLPELQKGSSIMPGKVNPVIPEVVLQVSAQVIGNDTAITVGGLQGQFELNVRIPLIARNLLQSLQLLAEHLARLRREVRRRDQGQQGRHRRLRRGDARRRDRAQRRDRLRQGGRDRQGRHRQSGRPLREVALEQGVDAKLYDATIDLRKIAPRQPLAGSRQPLSRLRSITRPAVRRVGSTVADLGIRVARPLCACGGATNDGSAGCSR